MPFTAPRRRVRIFMDLNCGQTVCDIHGTHHARLWGEVYTRYGVPRYNFIRYSECFGREDFKELSRENMLKVMDEHADMPHMRSAYREFRKARKMIEADAFTQKYIRERLAEMDSQITPEADTPAVNTWVSLHTSNPHPAGTANHHGGIDWGGMTTAITNTTDAWSRLIQPEIRWEDELLQPWPESVEEPF